MAENKFTHLTAKERYKLSFPARIVLSEGLLKGKILDFGCGFGTDVNILKESGFDVTGYDPHYFPEYPEGKYDTILCFYVLNVLLQDEQAKVLMKISQLLNPDGKAYFAVRRDIVKDGFRRHKIHGEFTYQCNVRLPYKSIFKNDNCQIYEYQHFNKIRHFDENQCPFCNPDKDREMVLESATVFSIFDKYPVSQGHTLVIPKKHEADYFNLSFREQSACWFMVNEIKSFLDEKYNPDGYNIGININPASGQTVPHVHIHVIPRYNGDIPEPEGGVRGVIPSKQKYKT